MPCAGCGGGGKPRPPRGGEETGFLVEYPNGVQRRFGSFEGAESAVLLYGGKFLNNPGMTPLPAEDEPKTKKKAEAKPQPETEIPAVDAPADPTPDDDERKEADRDGEV